MGTRDTRVALEQGWRVGDTGGAGPGSAGGTGTHWWRGTWSRVTGWRVGGPEAGAQTFPAVAQKRGAPFSVRNIPDTQGSSWRRRMPWPKGRGAGDPPETEKKKKRLGDGKPRRKDKEMGSSRRSYMKNSRFGEGQRRRQKSSKKFMTTSTFWVEGHRVPGTVSARRLGSLVADPSCLTSHLCVPEGRTPDMAHLNWVFPVNGLSVYVPLKCIC